MMEAALERTGDMQISLSLQETIRGAIKRKILYLMPVLVPDCGLWHPTLQWLRDRTRGAPKTALGIHNDTAIEVSSVFGRTCSELHPMEPKALMPGLRPSRPKAVGGCVE